MVLNFSSVSCIVIARINIETHSIQDVAVVVNDTYKVQLQPFRLSGFKSTVEVRLVANINH